jgi:soluble lytic murein transglycosylase-like protein
LLLLASATVLPAVAAIQSWEDGDAIHLSNLEPPQLGALLTDDPPEDSLARVSVQPPAGVGAGRQPAAVGAGPDLRRLIAHDPRTAERLLRYAPMVSTAARLHGVDAALLQAVVAVESAYNPTARSRKGAIGLMQVMPATAARYGIRNLEDPIENLRAGCLYLKDLLQLFHENVDLAVAAYNAGENAVVRHGNRIPPYPETLRYVPQVVEIYRGLSN